MATDNILAVKALLEKGVNTHQKDKRGFTALHQAACGKDARIVKLLVQWGADVGLRDKSGFNAAFYANKDAPMTAQMKTILGPVLKVTTEDIRDFREMNARVHVIVDKRVVKKKKLAKPKA